jgi:hypothetical protein
MAPAEVQVQVLEVAQVLDSLAYGGDVDEVLALTEVHV